MEIQCKYKPVAKNILTVRKSNSEKKTKKKNTNFCPLFKHMKRAALKLEQSSLKSTADKLDRKSGPTANKLPLSPIRLKQCVFVQGTQSQNCSQED